MNKLEDIWRPIYYLGNSALVKSLGSFGDKATESLWYRHSNKLYYSEVQFVTFFCNMSFEKFPFDRHNCKFQMTNWLGSVEKVILSEPNLLDSSSSQMNNRHQFMSGKLNFDVEIFTLEPSFQKQSGYNHSVAEIQLDLSRNRDSLSKVTNGFYIPTGTFSFLSLISFFVNVEQVPGRMGMLVTLYLILINTYINIDAPSMRGFSYADVWFLGCQVTIAFAIIEYGALLAAMKLTKGKPKHADLVDIVSFLVSFVSFCTFIIVYWVCYAN